MQDETIFFLFQIYFSVIVFDFFLQLYPAETGIGILLYIY